jgi:hypothetical protein
MLTFIDDSMMTEALKNPPSPFGCLDGNFSLPCGDQSLAAYSLGSIITDDRCNCAITFRQKSQTLRKFAGISYTYASGSESLNNRGAHCAILCAYAWPKLNSRDKPVYKTAPTNLGGVSATVDFTSLDGQTAPQLRQVLQGNYPHV